MINLHELLGIKEETFSNYKVHFATGSNDKKAPYNAFLIDEFKEWQEQQTKKNCRSTNYTPAVKNLLFFNGEFVNSIYGFLKN